MMKKTIVVILLFLSSCFVSKQQEKVSSCRELIPETFYVRMESNPDAVVLDTRILSEYAEERIPRARFAGNHEKLNGLVDSLDRETPLFIYCEYEDRSNTVCNILTKEKKFENVYKLEGGYEMWKKVNLPVDTTKRKVF